MTLAAHELHLATDSQGVIGKTATCGNPGLVEHAIARAGPKTIPLTGMNIDHAHQGAGAEARRSWSTNHLYPFDRFSGPLHQRHP